MIKLIDEGHYRLLETKDQNKILTLINDDTFEERTYAWINAVDIGELLVTTHKRSLSPNKKNSNIDTILALGKFRLYEVKEDPEFTDLEHLELFVGQGIWQGYLLLSGLPTKKNLRRRIIPTDEVITKSG